MRTHAFVFALVYWELTAIALLLPARSMLELQYAVLMAIAGIAVGACMAISAEPLNTPVPPNAFADDFRDFVGAMLVSGTLAIWLGFSIATPTLFAVVAGQSTALLWKRGRAVFAR